MSPAAAGCWHGRRSRARWTHPATVHRSRAGRREASRKPGGGVHPHAERTLDGERHRHPNERERPLGDAPAMVGDERFENTGADCRPRVPGQETGRQQVLSCSASGQPQPSRRRSGICRGAGMKAFTMILTAETNVGLFSHPDPFRGRKDARSPRILPSYPRFTLRRVSGADRMTVPLELRDGTRYVP